MGRGGWCATSSCLILPRPGGARYSSSIAIASLLTHTTIAALANALSLLADSGFASTVPAAVAAAVLFASTAPDVDVIAAAVAITARTAAAITALTALTALTSAAVAPCTAPAGATVTAAALTTGVLAVPATFLAVATAATFCYHFPPPLQVQCYSSDLSKAFLDRHPLKPRRGAPMPRSLCSHCSG